MTSYIYSAKEFIASHPPHQKSINGVFVNFPVLELSVSFLCALEGNVFHVLLCSSQYICTESIMVVLCDIK